MRIETREGWTNNLIYVWDASLSKVFKLVADNVQQYTFVDVYKLSCNSIKLDKYYGWHVHQELVIHVGKAYKYRKNVLEGPVVIEISGKDPDQVAKLKQKVLDLLNKYNKKLGKAS